MSEGLSDLTASLFGKLAIFFALVGGILLETAKSYGYINGNLFTFSKTDGPSLSSLSPQTQAIGLLICLISSTIITYLFYVICFRKMDRVRGEKDVGYFIEANVDRRETTNRLRKLRAIGELPPAYANGWYALIESHRLKKGEAKSLNIAGLVVAAFRDQKGVARVLDAYCPHLGANLGMGGRVKDDTIECPFHGWRFSGEDGKCVAVPYLTNGKIPDQARVKSHCVQEVNGWVNIWYDAEGREPHWTIPEYEDITRGQLMYCGRTEHLINCHMEEIPENGADLAHLPVIHGPSLFAGTDIRNMFEGFWTFTEHEWESSWEAESPPESYKAYMDLVQGISLFGKTIPFTKINVHVEQIGPAIVYLNFDTIFGRCVIQHVVSPVEPMLQKLVHNVYANRWMPMFFAKILMQGMAMQVERDLFVWNNKKYMGRPLLLKTSEDALILRHRRWFSQFYSENSPKLQMKKADDLTW